MEDKYEKDLRGCGARMSACGADDNHSATAALMLAAPFNTDEQIFSDAGVPCAMFMENYDIHRTGYQDTHDTMENIDLDYGAAVCAITIEAVASEANAKNSPL